MRVSGQHRPVRRNPNATNPKTVANPAQASPAWTSDLFVATLSPPVGLDISLDISSSSVQPSKHRHTFSTEHTQKSGKFQKTMKFCVRHPKKKRRRTFHWAMVAGRPTGRWSAPPAAPSTTTLSVATILLSKRRAYFRITNDPPRTRTWNLRLRRPTPYPLGQQAK